MTIITHRGASTAKFSHLHVSRLHTWMHICETTIFGKRLMRQSLLYHVYSANTSIQRRFIIIGEQHNTYIKNNCEIIN